jgi:hypothetical protein
MIVRKMMGVCFCVMIISAAYSGDVFEGNEKCSRDWQLMRSEHSAHNNQSTPDGDQSDNDMQNCESFD